MNKIYTLCLLASMVFLSACSDHYYAPVMYRNSASYMQKPMSADSIKSATYISGGVSTGNGINFTDEFYLGRIDLHHANTFKNFNLAYGVYGFAGSYQNTSVANTDPNYFDTKSFIGFGAKASANFFVPLNNHADFRFIGVEFSYNNESGAYANYRNTIKNIPGYHIYDKNSTMNIGLTSEVAWRGTGGAGVKHAIRGYLGTYLGPNQFNFSGYNQDLREKLDPAVSYSLQYKSYIFVFDLQPTTSGTLRFGYAF